jgi:inward rectifier potassium channel
MISGAPVPPVAGGGEPVVDLGFGTVVAQQVRGRFLAPDGTPQSRKYGLGRQAAAHAYQRALAVSWPVFLSWSVGGLLLLNGCLALLWNALGPGAIAGTEALDVADPFLRALAFSTGIFTTVGTPGMHAVGATAHWLLILESLFGPIVLVALGGLMVARLTRPRARIRFSTGMVMAPYRGGRGLMFRLVNVAPGELSDVNVRVNVAMFHDTGDGRRERRFHQLALERTSVEFFTLHWTVVHPVDAKSPLAGMTPEQLRAATPEFLVIVHAHEETFSTHVTARASYLSADVRWDAKFADMFVASPDGVITIDVERLDRADRLPDGTTSVPAALEGVTASA